jgi:hypothetical protein
LRSSAWRLSLFDFDFEVEPAARLRALQPDGAGLSDGCHPLGRVAGRRRLRRQNPRLQGDNVVRSLALAQVRVAVLNGESHGLVHSRAARYAERKMG